MRIKVPLEVALVLIALVVVLWVLIGFGALGKLAERKLPPRSVKILGLSIGVAATAAGLWLFSTFYFITKNRHPVYPGLNLFDLGDVVLAAILVAAGAAAFAWVKLRPVGAALALLGGAAIFAKPLALPLVSTIDYGPDRGKTYESSFTSESHLYFVLSGAALFVVGIILLLKRQAPAGALPVGASAARAGAGGASKAAAAKAPRDLERLIAAPDSTFASINKLMRQLDLRPAGDEAASGEPEVASWTDGEHTVSYRYVPDHGLRLLEVRGPTASYLRNDMLNLVYMPTLEGYKVSELLRSDDRAAQLRGIAAAEHIGVNGDERFYIEPVSQLAKSSDKEVALAAERVRDALLARQRGA